MSDRLLLRAVEPQSASEDTATKADATFFVLQRQNGHWSPAAKIISVHATEDEARAEAVKLHTLNSQQVFGVAALRMEARIKPVLTDIVEVAAE